MKDQFFRAKGKIVRAKSEKQIRAFLRVPLEDITPLSENYLIPDIDLCNPKHLERGRSIGAPLGGKAIAESPRPEDCPHCEMMGYTRMCEHLGHLAARSLLDNRPQTIAHVRMKLIGNGSWRYGRKKR